MFRNYLAAALRNLWRSKLYSAISIFGLAIGICAAILMALVLRNQLTHDRFIDGYERTYLLVHSISLPGRATRYYSATDRGNAAAFKVKFPEVEATARLTREQVSLRRGESEAIETIYWADPTSFAVLPLPAVAGDLQTALARPDGIVLTRAAARQYFGRDNPVGEEIELITRNRRDEPPATHVMTVTAVIEDLPVNGTQLQSGIFASGRGAFSTLAVLDAMQRNPGMLGFDVRTYLRLAAPANIATVEAALPSFVPQLMRMTPQMAERRRPAGDPPAFQLVRLDKVHLFDGLNPGINARLAIEAVVCFLILFIACSNFVNLTTARSVHRAREIGIRKVAGAERRALILQFLGESMLYVGVAAIIGVTLAEFLIPSVNAALDAGAERSFWRDPAVAALVVLATGALGVLAGLYPAFVASAFRPVTALKGRIAHSGRANALRQALVAAQFAILIVLVIAAATVYRQRQYATQDALRVDTEQVLIIRSNAVTNCEGALLTELRALEGVNAASCSSLPGIYQITLTMDKDGTALPINRTVVKPGLLELYELEPIAGRFFRPDEAGQPLLAASKVIINETAVRRLGYASPGAAIGQTMGQGSRDEIIGVVRDFSFASVEEAIEPNVYFTEALPGFPYTVHLKLAGEQIPETLAAIDRVWAATGDGQPIDRVFLDAHIQSLYLSMLRQAQGFAVFSGIAVVLACLGLVGLSAAAAARRTKEIGIRKALGASSGDVLRLLSWEFAKPILWANVIAWPVAYIAMSRWLNGFAYHVELQAWMFAAAGALSLIIALVTVSAQCWMVARAKPIGALRYE